MKVLVTGAKGFFGSWLIPGLAGHEVVTYDLTDGQDMQDVGALAEAMLGCDAVIHLAAYPHFKPEIPSQDFERRNIIGTARVVQAMQRTKVKRLVYTSSGAIYGFGPGRPLEGWIKPPIVESKYPSLADWQMIDAYGGSKLSCEEWLKTVKGIAVTCLRVNCIEPYHEGAKDQGAHWGWWCSQKTAIRAYLAALERERTGFAVVNVGEPNPNLDLTQLSHLLDGSL